ncbi:hypothetical protein quinque_002283 [Culex quinquefasciatus]
MFDVFGSVKGLLKLDQVCIDNNIFRLHYKATVVILIAFSLLVTSRQYIGDPIDCIVDEIPLNVMDTYCWIYSTFTIPNRLTGVAGKDIVQPGVSSHVDGHDEVKYHKYYQWVCFVLFFQAMLFYVPRYLWKTWEAGRIKMLVLDLNMPVVNDECKDERKKILVDYFVENINRHNFYAIRFFICEFQLNAPRPKNKLSKKKPAWYQVRALCSRQCKRTRIWRCLKRNQRRDKERSRRKLRRSTRSSRTTRATRAPSRPTPKRMTKPRSGQAEAGGSASDAMIVVGDQPNANDTKQEEVIDREEWRLQQKQQLKRPIAESLSTDSNAGQGKGKRGSKGK